MQVTSHQLRQQKEVEKQAAAEEAKRRDLAAKREVSTLPLALKCSLQCNVDQMLNVLPRRKGV